MVYRPLHSFGRFVLAACAVSLGAASLGAQTTPSTTAPVGPNLSRVDVFLGYSYYGAHGMVKPAGIAYSSVDYGGTVSGAYYFNKYVGMEVAVVGHPNGKNDQLYTASAGPIFRAHMQNYTLFAHANAGGVRIGGPNNNDETGGPTPVYYNPNQWGVTLAVGGGMDYDLPFFNNRFSLRLFQADYRYVHADFGPGNGSSPVGGRANIGAAELSTGIVTHFGSIVPPPPVTYSCAVSPATVYPGDPITATGTALNLNPKKTATFTWTTDGGTINGTSSTANIDTKTAAAGTYTVKGHVTEGNKPVETADCTAQYTVKAFEPPTISCSASPSSVNPGDSSTITASAMSPQNRPLTYSYSSTAGSVSGTSSTATLTTAGAAPGTITVTCNVVDDKGQTASSTTTVSIAAPVAPHIVTKNLCSINFDRDPRRPARVNNEAKACLDDIALNLQNASDAKVAVVGNSASSEKMGKKLAAERAVNTKEYLVKEKGVDSSRITVYTGTEDGKTVSSTLVPTGATLDSGSWTAVDESAVKAPAPKKRHKK
jgi:outer membrane protein OmpA-like peptidoglycan-associated protein